MAVRIGVAALLAGAGLLHGTQAFAPPRGVSLSSPRGDLVLRRTSVVAALQAAPRKRALGDEAGEALGQPLPPPWRVPLLLGFWAVFTVYAFVLSPGGGAEAAAADNERLMTMASNPFDPSIEPLFICIFNALGLLPAINFALLVPGSKDQKPLPTLPFVGASLALGFFALGPYFALREFRPKVTRADLSGPGKVAESKLFAAGVFLSSLGLLGFLVVNALPDGGHVATFGQLFQTSRFAHISSLDLTVLSVINYATISEDMRRRPVGDNLNGDTRTFYDPAKAALFAAVPVVGPATYLLLRPPLPEE